MKVFILVAAVFGTVLVVCDLLYANAHPMGPIKPFSPVLDTTIAGYSACEKGLIRPEGDTVPYK